MPTPKQVHVVVRWDFPQTSQVSVTQVQLHTIGITFAKSNHLANPGCGVQLAVERFLLDLSPTASKSLFQAAVPKIAVLGRLPMRQTLTLPRDPIMLAVITLTLIAIGS